MKSINISGWARDEHGATLVEYGIAVVLAVAVGTAGLLALGNQVNDSLKASSDGMSIASIE